MSDYIDVLKKIGLNFRVERIKRRLSQEKFAELANVHKPYGLEQNKKIAQMGGNVSKVARDNLEQKLGRSVISKENTLNYEYIDENKHLENKDS